MTLRIMNGMTLDNLSDIFDSLTNCVIVLDREAKIVMVNPIFCNIIGTTPEHCIGKETKELIAEGLYDRSVVYETIESGKEIAAIVKTGTGVDLLSRSRLVYTREGKIKFVVVTSTPISFLNSLTIALEKEKNLSDIYFSELEQQRKILLLDENFVFESPEMKSLLDHVKRVAPLNFTVLITGESGVGKEVLAKTIHNNSYRNNSFIPVIIPSIPENLLEAELFGYKSGAFTGALPGGKIGLFEASQGGTLFLDEVGDIPYPMQVKILRAIETGEIARLGCNKFIKLDLRIVAATNKDLHKMVKAGTFREDLFYRLNAVPINIKPLRKRQEDIEPLCDFFIRKINTKYGLNKYLMVDAMNELKRYHWPGNIRELRNVLERLTARSDKNCLSDQDVKAVLTPSEGYDGTREHANKIVSIPEAYKVFEKNRILTALKNAGGNKSKAAELLGISRTKLYNKLKTL